jgi:hypothetical protein
MKTLIKRLLFTDRFITVTVAASILIAVLIFIFFISAGNIVGRNDTLKKQMGQMQGLSDELAHINNAVRSRERKIGLTKINSVVSALEQSLKSLDIKAKVIKPLGKKRVKEYTVEEAELQIENISLNKIVNLLYKIENSPVPIRINESAIKSTFENPDNFFISLSAALISK